MPTQIFSAPVRAGGILTGLLATLLILSVSLLLMGQSYLSSMQEMLNKTQLNASLLQQEVTQILPGLTRHRILTAATPCCWI